MKNKMLILGLLGLLIVSIAIVVSIAVFRRYVKEPEPEIIVVTEPEREIIVVAGREVRLTPRKKFVAEIDGKKQVMWIRRYDPPYDENQPPLRSIEQADWSTPEASRFSRISATTIEWLKKSYTSESWARRTKSSIEKQLAHNHSRGGPKDKTHTRFYFRVDLKWDGRDYALLFFGIEDAKEGGTMHKKGVMWYSAYVREPDGWKRDTFLDAWGNRNPLFDYFTRHLDELDKLSQTIK